MWRIAIAVFLLVCSEPAVACLWDRDTLAAEADGRMETVNAILGRFDRYPDRFYEMRLERVAKELEADPARLGLYDDAGVACDRLHRSDEAIDFMARKRAALDRLPEGTPDRADHEYRYLANLGTFYVHRWVNLGASRESLGDLQRGRDFIAKAIELNPDAHFGRERYQLFAIEYLLDPLEVELDPIDHRPRPSLPIMMPAVEHGWDAAAMNISSENQRLKQLGYEDAVKGFTGLATLGAGAESVDVMHTLAVLLQVEGRSSLSFVADLRAKELLSEGRRSLNPGAEGMSADGFFASWANRRRLDSSEEERVSDWFVEARKATDERNRLRIAYVGGMLDAGHHPDLFPDEWAKAPEGPALPVMPARTAQGMAQYSYFFIFIGLITFVVLLYSAQFLFYRDRSKLY